MFDFALVIFYILRLDSESKIAARTGSGVGGPLDQSSPLELRQQLRLQSLFILRRHVVASPQSQKARGRSRQADTRPLVFGERLAARCLHSIGIVSLASHHALGPLKKQLATLQAPRSLHSPRGDAQWNAKRNHDLINPLAVQAGTGRGASHGCDIGARAEARSKRSWIQQATASIIGSASFMHLQTCLARFLAFASPPGPCAGFRDPPGPPDPPGPFTSPPGPQPPRSLAARASWLLRSWLSLARLARLLASARTAWRCAVHFARPPNLQTF